MAVMKVEPGMKWGKVEVLNVEAREVWSDLDQQGVKDTEVDVTLRCECGEVWVVDADEVNKTRHRACEDCLARESAEQDGAVLQARESAARLSKTVLPKILPGRPMIGRYKRVAISTTLPLDVLAWLTDYAGGRGDTVSAVVTEALRRMQKQEQQ